MVACSYESVERMIHKLCWRFVKCFGLDFDDCLETAMFAYVKAAKSYDETKGKYTTHIWTYVQNSLRSFSRNESRRKKHYKPWRGDVKEHTKPKSLGTLVSGLSDDAQSVVELITDASTDLIESFRYRSRYVRLRVLREFLWNRNWSMPQVTEVFGELEEAFSS